MGKGCPVLLIGQRYGSGISESPASFISGVRTGHTGRFAVVEAGVTHRRDEAFTLFDLLTFKLATAHFFFCCVLSLSWRTRWLPSAAASLSDCWH